MTTDTLRRIRKMTLAGLDDKAVARVLGVSADTALYWRKYLGLPPVTRYRRELKCYTVLDARTGEVLCTGNAGECAQALGVKTKSFREMYSRWKRTGRGKYEFREEITMMEQPEGAAAV